MTTDAKREWLTPGNPAYVLSSTMVAGVGSYLTATKVTIKSVGVRDVKVNDGTAGGDTRFRVSDLTAPRTGGRWASDDELVPVTDPRVGRALRARRSAVVADQAVGRIRDELKNVINRPVHLYERGDEAIDQTLTALAAINEAAQNAWNQLASLRAAH